MFAILSLKEKIQFVAVRTVQVGASVTILAIPVDLMVRGADSVFGAYFLSLFGA